MVTEHSQLELLLKLQRLLAEGSFTASYKFALLQTLIDLAVERGEDSDAVLRISIADIAEKFVSYYWRQVLPYVASRRPTEVAGIRRASPRPRSVWLACDHTLGV